MQPTADTPPARVAVADTDGLTDTPPRLDLAAYDREHVQRAWTQWAPRRLWL